MTYFVGTETTEIVGKLKWLKRDDANYEKCTLQEHKYEVLLYLWYFLEYSADIKYSGII
jgi:hypothetical protein